jgi:hypothetical protein
MALSVLYHLWEIGRKENYGVYSLNWSKKTSRPGAEFSMIAYTSKMMARNASHSNCSCPGDYVRLGYAPVRVPVMPVNRRAEFILACLGEA